MLGTVGAGLDWLESVDAFTIDPDLPLRLTTWSDAQFYLVAGAAALGISAAMGWWAPLAYGRHLNPALARLTALLLFVGSLAGALGFALTGFVTGQPSDPALNARYDFLVDPSTALNTLGAVGLLIFGAGAVLLLLDVAISLIAGKGAEANDNPWGAFTPEWDTPADPTESAWLPALTSGTPLLEAHEAEEVSV